jgi:hypothetical protein
VILSTIKRILLNRYLKKYKKLFHKSCIVWGRYITAYRAIAPLEDVMDTYPEPKMNCKKIWINTLTTKETDGK